MKTSPAVEDREIRVSLTSLGTDDASAQHVGCSVRVLTALEVSGITSEAQPCSTEERKLFLLFLCSQSARKPQQPSLPIGQNVPLFGKGMELL